MEDEPATLSIWDQIVQSIESKVKYTRGLTCAISDVKVTDIFYTKSGKVDEDAIMFWSQLIAHRGIKTCIETEFQGELKRWGAVHKVSQIPLRKDLNLSGGFKEFIKKKIRQTPSLWKIERVALFKPPKQQDIEEVAVTTVPATPQAITIIHEHITPSESEPQSGAKRKLSVMKDPLSLSTSSQRRVKNVVSGMIQALNYTPSQVEQIGHLLISKQSSKRLSDNMSASDDSSTQMVSSLVIPTVQKLQRRHQTFTDEEKIDIVECFAECTSPKQVSEGLKHLHAILGGRFDSVDVEKLRRWRKWYKKKKRWHQS